MFIVTLVNKKNKNPAVKMQSIDVNIISNVLILFNLVLVKV